MHIRIGGIHKRVPLESNENKITTDQNFQDTTKAFLKGKFLSISVCKK